MARASAFLSHKAIDGKLAAQVKEVLKETMPIDVFLSEEIDKAEEFRNDIWRALKKAKFFIFLYTDPKEDWSWCFFEAGAYHTRPGRTKAKPRIYCLHPKGEEPPKPLSNLQNTEAVAKDIMRWLEDLGEHFEPRPSKLKLKRAAKKIEGLIRARDIYTETSIKPYIWITPAMPGGAAINWKLNIPSVALENALVSIDPVSQTKLGFSTLPKEICLLEFLKILDYDSRQSIGKPFWIDRFFRSIDMAARGQLHLDEVAYFRHEQGKIYRPVVVSVAKSEHHVKIKVVFAHAFGAPMTDHPTTVQRLADGVRLGVRTRLEVVNEFSGRLSDICEEKKKKQLTDLGRQYTVGNQLIAALEAIMEEARAFGIRPEQSAPTLFDDAGEQDEYERIRAEGLEIWDKLKEVIRNEDETGKYDDSEKLLKRLETINEEYLGMALPRLAALLTPAASGRRAA